MDFNKFLSEIRKKDGEETARRANTLVNFETLKELLIRKEIISEGEFRKVREEVCERYKK
ncbi:MAG: hypothetical protein PHI88_00315 [Candidatus Pacebacteria bacterium]|nr:hypothetical protein [Candidatus Paceibacterota bacterium]